MRRFSIGLANAAVFFAVAACQAVGSAGGTGGKLDGTSWQLESQDVSGSATAVPAGVTVDARFTANRIAGFSGCNSYTGEATVTGSSLEIGALASTQMACIGPAGSVETAYLANLRRAATFTATEGRLTIFDGAGKAVLVYQVGKANPLAGTWNVTGINNGRDAVVSPATGTTITATFTEDGKVSGSGGCNQFNGSYTLSAQNLSIGPLRTTRMACEPAVMLQETQFFTAMGRITTIDPPSGRMLMLRDAAGAMQVVLGSR